MSANEISHDPGTKLTTDSVIDYLIGKGIVDEAVATVEALGGGVSADTFAVHAPGGSWVVKQALAQLKVAVDWHADPGRILNEAAALRLAGDFIADGVPPVTLVDPDRLVLVMQHAPRHLHDWKSELMDGGSAHSVDTAARLGEMLAVLHGRTFDDQTIAAGFGDTDSFVELRIDPFHRTVARRLPDVAVQLDELADELISRPRCLVHGDYSPKNILASGSEAWVLDWEVAHYGNPVFDLAFMLAHLLCKTVHMPMRHDLYRGCAESFVAAYVRNAPTALQPNPDGLARHTAAIVLARTDGKSPVGYLQTPQRDSARRLARDVLSTDSIIDDVVQHLWRGFR